MKHSHILHIYIPKFINKQDEYMIHDVGKYYLRDRQDGIRSGLERLRISVPFVEVVSEPVSLRETLGIINGDGEFGVDRGKREDFCKVLGNDISE